MEQKTSPERRSEERTTISHLRLKATLAIIMENETIGDTVLLKDFSNNGLGVYFKLKVQENTPIRISLMDQSFTPVEGRIAWCMSTEGDLHAPPAHPYRLGIELKSTTDEARTNQNALIEHLKRLLNRGQT